MVDCLHSKPLTIVICILACFGGVETTWWFLSQLQLSAVGARVVCDNIPGLARRQRHLCQKNPDVMISISRGARSGVSECQFQFRDQRWNCSTVERDSSVYGKLMLKLGSREAAFVYAISSAGVVHSITRSCSKGELLNCACDPTKKGMHRDARGEFTWGGCTEYVGYGNIFSRKFIDAREKRVRDARALMNLHNNRAGRKAVQKHVKLECKCHGVSGSCTVRTCWLAMMDFRRVGGYLKHKYDGATEVMMNQAGTGIVVANRHHKRPTRTDLVYFEASPDYCVNDPETGSLGTAGRKCNKTSLGTDGCDIMCCGRGYDTSRVLRTHKCQCKFQWCCVVRCNLCRESLEEYTCKAPKSRLMIGGLNNNAEQMDAAGHFRLRQKNSTKWRRTTTSIAATRSNTSISSTSGGGKYYNRSTTDSTTQVALMTSVNVSSSSSSTSN